MSRFDQQMREVARSLARLTGNKTQAAQFRRKLEKKIQLAAAKKSPDIALSLVKSGRAGWANDPDTPGGAVLVERGLPTRFTPTPTRARMGANRI